MEEKYDQELVCQVEEPYDQTVVTQESFQLKSARKEFSRVGFAYLLTTIVYNGGQILCAFLAAMFYPQALESMDSAMAVQMLPTYLICVPIIIWMISRLPAGFRTVFNLYVIEGFTHKDIAEMLGISEVTSRSQLSRARAMLQEQIRKYRNV